MNSIRFEHVSKSFGKTKIINDLNMEVKKGERMILLGPSGCGKSTILRMISGLETITAGKLYLNDMLANDIDSGDHRIALMHQGDLQMLDTPARVYHRPANIFVATFIGSPSMNILTSHLDGRDLIVADNRIALPDMWLNQIKKSGCARMKLGIRPEDVLLTNTPSPNSIPVAIRYIEDYGNRVGFYFNMDEEVISIMSNNTFNAGEKIYWSINPEKLHFFDTDTERSLGYPEELE